METQVIKKLIRNEVIKYFIEKMNVYYVPVAISNRHVHLSSQDIEILFGKGYKLKSISQLSQPGQYVCEEKVSFAGPKGIIHDIRVIGPERKDTQLEFSVTDTYTLGIKPMVRMSGDLDGTPGGKLIGPVGEVELIKGVIVSARHLHISGEEAEWYGVKNGEVVRIRKEGTRKTAFDNVIVRTGQQHSLEMHIDTDEANAAGITCGELIIMEKLNISLNKAGPDKCKAIYKPDKELITEKRIDEILALGYNEVLYKKGSIITPLARDRASELKIPILFE